MSEEAIPVERVSIDFIRVEGRHRRELGDLTSLMKSMEENGLINPVTITSDGRLLAGGRRIAAARRLGWTHIDARVVDTFDDATRALLIERDENTERKAMTPSEMVSLGKALEALRRPEQHQRRVEAGKLAAAKRLGRHIDDGISSSREENVRASMRTQDEVGAALGVSGSTYFKAKTVVDAAADPESTDDERAVAESAMADMDAGRDSVAGAYERVKKGRPAPQPRTKPTIDKLAAQRRAIASTEAALSGLAHAAGQITELHPEITSEEAARWVDSLSESRRAITVLINLLRERSNV